MKVRDLLPGDRFLYRSLYSGLGTYVWTYEEWRNTYAYSWEEDEVELIDDIDCLKYLIHEIGNESQGFATW